MHWTQPRTLSHHMRSLYTSIYENCATLTHIQTLLILDCYIALMKPTWTNENASALNNNRAWKYKCSFIIYSYIYKALLVILLLLFRVYKVFTINFILWQNAIRLYLFEHCNNYVCVHFKKRTLHNNTNNNNFH